jgi:hypothetical protein
MTTYQIGQALKDRERQLANIDKEIIELKAALRKVSEVLGYTTERSHVTSQAPGCIYSHRRHRILQLRRTVSNGPSRRR